MGFFDSEALFPDLGDFGSCLVDRGTCSKPQNPETIKIGQKVGQNYVSGNPESRSKIGQK